MADCLCKKLDILPKGAFAYAFDQTCSIELNNFRRTVYISRFILLETVSSIKV